MTSKCATWTTDRIKTAFIRRNNFNVLSLPSKSLDLNAIEHLWGDYNDAYVKDNLRRCSINLKQELYRPIWLQQHVYKLQAEMANWHFIQNIWRHLSRPMERRCQAIIGSNGGHMRHLVELSCLNLQMCNALWRTWNLIFALTWKYLIH